MILQIESEAFFCVYTLEKQGFENFVRQPWDTNTFAPVYGIKGSLSAFGESFFAARGDTEPHPLAPCPFEHRYTRC